MHYVSTFLCVYVWSDLSCDLSVIEGSGAAHMGSSRTVLIISPRDISGSSVLQCCRHASGPRTRGKVSPWTRSGHVLAWPGLRSLSGGHPGHKKVVHQVWCRHGFGRLFVAMILPCDRDKTRIEGRGHRVAGSPVALWGTCCPNILIFWILDYGIFN